MPGASKEVDLPLGTELRSKVKQETDIRYDQFGERLLSGDPAIAVALRKVATVAGPNGLKLTFDDLQKACWQISGAMDQSISIDNFIDTNRGDLHIELSGKLAIASCILKAERKCKLYFDSSRGDQSMDFAEGTWFHRFFQLIHEGCHPSDLPQRLSEIAIICFNYDRCIEHYLYEAIQNYYNFDASHTAATLSNLRIFHPYGDIGALPWANDLPPGEETKGFGEEATSESLLSAAGRLRTFTEGIDQDNSDISELREILNSADRLVFLGFWVSSPQHGSPGPGWAAEA